MTNRYACSSSRTRSSPASSCRSFDATYNGPAALLFVEPTYLHDAVVAAPGPVLAIEAVDETSPIVVRTPGNNSYLAVVMPVLVGTPRSRKR